MNGLLYLFSVWLLLLTGLPCPDADCHAQTEKRSQAAGTHSDDEQAHKAPCSPFCHCATCPGFAAPRAFSYARPAELVTADSSKRVFSYHSLSQSAIVFSVWQPPKY